MVNHVDILLLYVLLYLVCPLMCGCEGFLLGIFSVSFTYILPVILKSSKLPVIVIALRYRNAFGLLDVDNFFRWCRQEDVNDECLCLMNDGKSRCNFLYWMFVSNIGECRHFELTFGKQSGVCCQLGETTTQRNDYSAKRQLSETTSERNDNSAKAEYSEYLRSCKWKFSFWFYCWPWWEWWKNECCNDFFSTFQIYYSRFSASTFHSSCMNKSTVNRKPYFSNVGNFKKKYFFRIEK